MAWSFVGLGAAVESNAASHTLVEPSGCQYGDLLVACISSKVANTGSIVLPAGWTLAFEQKSSDTSLVRGLMAYAVRGFSAPNLTFIHPADPSVALGRIVAYRGNSETPLDRASGRTLNSNSTNVSVFNARTTTANELIVMMVAGAMATSVSNFRSNIGTNPSGTTADDTDAPSTTWQERADSSVATATGIGLAIADVVKTTAGETADMITTASGSARHTALAAFFMEGTIIVPAQPGKVKIWNGSAWVEKPVKQWNGSSWETKPAKIWDGSAWISVGS